MFAIALGFVARFGSWAPYVDDWGFVPLLTGQQAADGPWLWSQHNEHRNPLLKLILLGAYRISKGDVRAGMFLNVIGFGLLALALCLGARAVRGRSAYADAFFPIVLLNLGHAGTFLWAMTITYVVPTILVSSILLVVLRTRGRFSIPSASVFGLCLISLPLCGLNGMIYTPTLGAWAAYAAYRSWLGGGVQGRRGGVVAFLSVLATFTVCILYFIGWEPVKFSASEYISRNRPRDAAKGVLMFFGIALGPVRSIVRPTLVGLLPAGLMAGSIACAVVAVVRRRSWDRLEALGLLAFLAGCSALALAVGWGRSQWNPDSIHDSRYAAMAVPCLIGIYFTWEVCGPSALRPLGRMWLLMIPAAFLGLDTAYGLGQGRGTRSRTLGLEKDIRDHLPMTLVARRNLNDLHPFYDQLIPWLEALKRSGYSPYKSIADDPPFREVGLPPEPSKLYRAESQGGTFRTTDGRSCVEFRLDQPEFVCGLRLVVSVETANGHVPFFRVEWGGPGRSSASGPESYTHFQLATGKGQEVDVPVYIYGRLDRIRILPDKGPCAFRIRKITLLMPTSASQWPPEPESPPSPVEAEAPGRRPAG